VDLCVTPDKNLSQKGTGRVNQDVPNFRLAKGHKGLMPLVKRSITYGNQQGEGRPMEFPPGALRANTVKNSDAEGAKFRYVRKFADADMHQA